MFPTQEFENEAENKSLPTPAMEPSFDSVEQFGQWLEADLDLLVSSFAEFETDKSVRTFFKRA